MAYLESASWQRQGQPPQWGILIRGNLPTPCHQLRVQVSPPTEDKTVHIQVYSLIAPGQVCIEVLQPFETFVPLTVGPEDGYRVLINGVPLEKISSGATK